MVRKRLTLWKTISLREEKLDVKNTYFPINSSQNEVTLRYLALQIL